MKKLKKMSLENFDRLASFEASNLIGGKDNPTVPPPTTTPPIWPNTTKPPKTISPNILGGTASVGKDGVSISWPIGG